MHKSLRMLHPTLNFRALLRRLHAPLRQLVSPRQQAPSLQAPPILHPLLREFRDTTCSARNTTTLNLSNLLLLHPITANNRLPINTKNPTMKAEDYQKSSLRTTADICKKKDTQPRPAKQSEATSQWMTALRAVRIIISNSGTYDC